MFKNKKRSLVLVLLSIFLSPFAVSCSDAKPNTKETTPPVLSWSTWNDKKQTSTTYNNANPGVVRIDGSSLYNIYAHADDAGGIKSITLDGSGRLECSYMYPSGVVNVLRSPVSINIPHQAQTFTPNALGNVPTTATLAVNSFRYQSLSCGKYYAGSVGEGERPGYHEFTAGCGVFTLTMTAENFSGRVAHGQMQLNPGC